MPRSSAQRKAAPPSVDLRRYGPPRPANDAHGVTRPGVRETRPGGFGKKQPAPLDDARREALRTGGRKALEAAINLIVPRPLTLAINGLDYIASTMTQEWAGARRQMPSSGWRMTGICKDTSVPPGNNWSSGGGNNGRWANICLGGQATAIVAPPEPFPLPNANLEAIWAYFYVADSIGTVKMAHRINYVTQGAYTHSYPRRYYPSGKLNAPINPNIARFVNPTPQPLSTPVPRPAPQAHRIAEITVSPRDRSGLRPRSRPAPRVARAARSRPPEDGVKERKGKAAQVGAALFSALDKLSEGSEVVDAFYQALPAHVRKRWNRPERPGDNMGQYGIDGADWKLQALYHNWDKVDLNEAIKNVLANELEDRLYGAAHKARGELTFRGRKRKRGHFG